MVSPRRNRAWADLLVAQNIGAGGNTKLDLLGGAPTMDTLTAVRVIVHLNVSPDVLSAIDGVVSFDVGIGVSSSEAFAVGVSALPDPDDATNYPPRGWIWVDRYAVRNTVGAGPIDLNNAAEIRADIRAMRKIDKGKMFIIMKLSTAAGSGFGVNVVGRVRVLCLT